MLASRWVQRGVVRSALSASPSHSLNDNKKSSLSRCCCVIGSDCFCPLIPLFHLLRLQIVSCKAITSVAREPSSHNHPAQRKKIKLRWRGGGLEFTGCDESFCKYCSSSSSRPIEKNCVIPALLKNNQGCELHLRTLKSSLLCYFWSLSATPGGSFSKPQVKALWMKRLQSRAVHLWKRSTRWKPCQTFFLFF